MKTTVYKARRACQLEVKVEFNSLDKNYHNLNLQFTTKINENDIEDLKISEFCPTISVYHIQDKNPTEVSLFLTFQKAKYKEINRVEAASSARFGPASRQLGPKNS